MKIALCVLRFAVVILTMLSEVDQVEGWLWCFPKEDCAWTPWGSWSACSRSCGPLGSKQRFRHAVWPSNCHGDDCDGSLSVIQFCNRFCLNGGDLINNECVCYDGWEGTCCEERDIEVSELINKSSKREIYFCQNAH